MKDWVELRIHGVSGTPPESLLGTPHVTQVAGDDFSRFFEPAPKPPDHLVEGYHWGKFTSGTWRQALSLLLVPFGLINATQFMLPEPISRFGKSLHAVASACLRAIALLLTLLFTFALSLILIDLIGWRWAAKTRLLKDFGDDRVLMVCVPLTAVAVLAIAFLGFSTGTRQPAGGTSPTNSPASSFNDAFYSVNPNAPTLRLLHLAAAFGLIALLADMARQGEHPNQDYGKLLTPVKLFGLVTHPDHGTELLRMLILSGLSAITVLVILLGDPERGVSLSWGRVTAAGQSLWQGLARLIALPLLAASVCALAIEIAKMKGIDRENAITGAARMRLVDFDYVAEGLMYVGVVVLSALYLVVVVLLWRGKDRRWSRREAFARLLELVPFLLTSLLALKVGPSWLALPSKGGLAIVTALMIWAVIRILKPAAMGGLDESYFRPYAGGMAPFLLAAVAVFVGIGFSAAAATAVSSALNLNADVSEESAKVVVGSVQVDGQRVVDVGTTPMLDRVAYAWGLTVGVILALILLTLLCYGTTRCRYRKHVVRMYNLPRRDDTELPDGWTRRVARAMFVARLKTWVPFFTIVFAAVGVLISGVQAYESSECVNQETGSICRVATNRFGLNYLSGPRSEPTSIFLINIGAWVFVAAAGLVVTVSRGAFKNSGLRRGINVIWDVISFWPHAVHPFVPRPYSRWTVLELRNRIRYHLGGRAGEPGTGLTSAYKTVVVCAHSQGSLISFAALMMLEPEERRHVAFVSCGSQLRFIFPRAFPAYVNFQSIGWLFNALGERWVNLYRATDPLAGPVLSWKHNATSSRRFPLPNGLGRRRDVWPEDSQRRRLSGHDWRLIDPVPYDSECETGPVNAIQGHHDFWLDPSWADALTFVRTLNYVPPSSPVETLE